MDPPELRFDALRAATEEFAAAALLGSGWDEALERLAAAARVTGAVLMCYRAHHLEAAVASSGAVEGVEKFRAGEAPPCSRLTRIKLGLDEGFRVDHDDYTDAELTRDPFYQEFQLPRGLFWNAVAKLSAAPDERGVELSFKRAFAAGPYAAGERAALDAVLPGLRMAARIANRVFDAESAGIAQLLQQRGDPVFELDAWGRVRCIRADPEGNPALPLRVIGRRLVAADRVAQPALDRAVAAAVTSPQRSAITPLLGPEGEPYYLQLVPVVGRARDIFLATAAVAVVIAARPRPDCRIVAPNLLREAFSLTDREAEVASLLGEGLDLPEIARRLRIDLGTVRNHLKSVFEKSGTHRQAELVALLARLRP